MTRGKKKLEKLEKQLQDIEKEIAALKVFRSTPKVQQFKRYLVGEKSFVKKQIADLKATSRSRQNEYAEKMKIANRNRSAKMKRTWRYLRSIQENYFPDKGLRELRTLFKKQREGMETDVPDVVWRNPSP